MKKNLITSLILLLFFLSVYSQSEKTLDALIVTGQCKRYHNWEKSSQLLKEHLLNTRLFNVDIAISPPIDSNMNTFNPDFENYNVVVIDYEGNNWSNQMLNNFIGYVKNGGGVIFVHTAFAAINGSEEFDEVVGLRYYHTDKPKSHVYWENGKMIKDKNALNSGFHPLRHDFLITTRDTAHPITKGLPKKWFHAGDDLYSKLCGPAKNITILATAYSDPAKGQNTTGRHEPMLFTVGYGEGRVLVCVMGHVGYKSRQGGISKDAMLCSGFITVFQRGAEWAATGNVTQSIPNDFPTETVTSIRSQDTEK